MKTELKRPLGVFLQGGGSLGAWQAAALEVLHARGLSFESVMGYSIGAVNGSAVAFGRLSEALERWRRLDGGVMRLSPRLWPISLFSVDPLRAFFDHAVDEDAAKINLKAEFTIVTSCPAEGASVNARFTPGGHEHWDGPLVEHAAASCAIPFVFPPVDLHHRGRRKRLVDGGVPMPIPIDFEPLSKCSDILVLEMVRADELGLRWRTPWRAIDQRARMASRALVDEGLQPLLRSGRHRVFRLSPSRRLEPMMLDFRTSGLSIMMAQGAADAESFLADPALFRFH